jgi:hypothetical protein
MVRTSSTTPPAFDGGGVGPRVDDDGGVGGRVGGSGASAGGRPGGTRVGQGAVDPGIRGAPPAEEAAPAAGT